MTIEQNKKDKEWEIECDLCHDTTVVEFSDAEEWSAMLSAIKGLGWKVIPLDRLRRPLANGANAADFQHQCSSCAKNPDGPAQGRFL